MSVRFVRVGDLPDIVRTCPKYPFCPVLVGEHRIVELGLTHKSASRVRFFGQVCAKPLQQPWQPTLNASPTDYEPIKQLREARFYDADCLVEELVDSV
jgi:hypothetical protein